MNDELTDRERLLLRRFHPNSYPSLYKTKRGQQIMKKLNWGKTTKAKVIAERLFVFTLMIVFCIVCWSGVIKLGGWIAKNYNYLIFLITG